ncbi:MAG: flagellar biosynthesis anti-sigma factor FlgM [Defluviitaleaceae bacterium]|nr:flagellar biosynthesis anti-sigma factor FlgM [Defluviitaleaceae bacterium]
MKITGVSALTALNRPTDVRKTERNNDTKRGTDVFEASDKAMEYSVARKGVSASDGDVRADKVAALQKRIANGDYNVSAYDVASRLVDTRI